MNLSAAVLSLSRQEKVNRTEKEVARLSENHTVKELYEKGRDLEIEEKRKHDKENGNQRKSALYYQAAKEKYVGLSNRNHKDRVFAAYACTRLGHIKLWCSKGCFSAKGSVALDFASELYIKILRDDWGWIDEEILKTNFTMGITHKVLNEKFENKQVPGWTSDSRCYLDDEEQCAHFFDVVCAFGKVLLNPRNPQYDAFLATRLFAAAYATGHESNQVAAFWYGRSLKIGFGVAQDIQRGVLLIQEAASRGVVRAFFALGVLYEGEGGGDKFPRNIHLAATYYGGAVKYGELSKTKPFFRVCDGFEDDHVATTPSLHDVQERREESSSREIMVLVTGHAFLISATATLAVGELQRLCWLGFIVPLLGVVFALFNVVVMFATWWRNKERIDPILFRLQQAKYAAFHVIYTGMKPPHEAKDRKRWRNLIFFVYRLFIPASFLGGWLWILGAMVKEKRDSSFSFDEFFCSP